MKYFNLLCACLCMSLATYAQPSAGTVTFGANILSARTGQSNSYQSVQARIGFFASDHTAIGLCLESGIAGNKSVPFALSVFSRFYTGAAEHRVVKFFVEAGAGIAHYAGPLATSEQVKPDENWMKASLYIAPGLNVFLGKVIALEVAPEYRYIASAYAPNRFGISAGLKFFLSEELFKRGFSHTFTSSF